MSKLTIPAGYHMPLTNNQAIKNFLNSLREKLRGNEEKKGGALHE